MWSKKLVQNLTTHKWSHLEVTADVVVQPVSWMAMRYFPSCLCMSSCFQNTTFPFQRFLVESIAIVSPVDAADARRGAGGP